MSEILNRIVEQKKQWLENQKRTQPLEELRSRVSGLPSRPRFREVLQRDESLQLIAEIKPRAPSSGPLTRLSAGDISRVYERECPAAVSVLTDRPFFGQGEDALEEVRSILTKPILRKDFTIDPYQIVQSAVIGADAILLIAALLEPERLHAFARQAHELGLDVLVEIHSRKELEALGWSPDLLGINNRSLEGDFSTDLSVTENLAPDVPDDTVLVSESGIHTPADIKRLSRVPGVDAVLVGTSLLEGAEEPDTIARRIRRLMASHRPGETEGSQPDSG